jgi:type I restriction enzyme S subunit
MTVAEALAVTGIEGHALPAGWGVATLGELFTIQQGKALSPSARTGAERYPFLRTANVFWGRIDLSTVDEMSFSADERRRLALADGDLLVCEGGAIGRCAIWHTELTECYYQNHLHRLRALAETSHPPFYAYWLRGAFTSFGLYEGAGNKTTIPNLSRARLASLPVPVPPLPEQQRIARILSTIEHSSRVAIAGLHTRSLVRDLVIRRAFDDTANALTWPLMPLPEVIDFQEGPGIMAVDFRISGVPLIRLAGVSSGASVLDGCNYLDGAMVGRRWNHFRIRAGDTLVSTSASLGRVAVVGPEAEGAIVYTGIIRMRPRGAWLTAEFIPYLFQSASFQRQAMDAGIGSVMRHFGPSHLKSMKLPVPSRSEQMEIVQHLSVVDRAVEAYSRSRDAASMTFQAALCAVLGDQI